MRAGARRTPGPGVAYPSTQDSSPPPYQSRSERIMPKSTRAQLSPIGGLHFKSKYPMSGKNVETAGYANRNVPWLTSHFVGKGPARNPVCAKNAGPGRSRQRRPLSPIPDAEPSGRIVRTIVYKIRMVLVTLEQRRKKMRQQLRHVEDPVTSVVALLAWAALSLFGLLVLALMLALGL